MNFCTTVYFKVPCYYHSMTLLYHTNNTVIFCKLLTKRYQGTTMFLDMHPGFNSFFFYIYHDIHGITLQIQWYMNFTNILQNYLVLPPNDISVPNYQHSKIFSVVIPWHFCKNFGIIRKKHKFQYHSIFLYLVITSYKNALC